MTPSTAPSSVGSTTLGSVASLNPPSLTILLLASRTAASITSAMADLPYSRLRWATGTLPGRNPRSWTRPLRSSSRSFTRASRSVAGTTTRYSRLRPSAPVSVTCIGTTLHGLMFSAKRYGSWTRPGFEPYPGQVLEKPPSWGRRGGSNPHDFRHGNLNPARLPIPPRPRRAGRPGGAAYITQGALDTTKIAPVLGPLATAAASHKGAKDQASEAERFAISSPRCRAAACF